MLPFRTRDGALLTCRADFARAPFANIHFYDESRRLVLFHLSLRADSGLAVVNRRREAGWGRELAHPVQIDRAGGTSVAFRFERGAVTVLVDDAPLGRFDAWPRPDRQGRAFLRRGFPDLGRIAHVSVEGGFAVEDVAIAVAPRGEAAQLLPEILLNERLEVEARGFAIPEDPVWLEAPGLEAPLPAVPRKLPHLVALPDGRHDRAIALVAALPGRVWDGRDDPEAVLELQMRAGAAPLGPPLRLSRDDLAARIEALLLAAGPQSDGFGVLQAIEHVRFAGLAGRLSAEARTSLAAAAAFYDLGEWLASGGAAGPQRLHLPPGPAPDPDSERMERVHRRFLRVLHDDPAADPIAFLRSEPLPAGPRRELLRALTEHFCVTGRFEDLFALAAAEGLEAMSPGDDAWRISTALPWLLLQGRLEEVARQLWRLGPETPGWLVTPAIAWVTEHLLSAAFRGSEKAREEILCAFVDLVRGRAARYWERTSCQHLVAASVTLMARAPHLADYLRPDIEAFVLRAYGLSRRFWTEVRARGIDLPPALAEARAAFAVIEAAAERGAADAKTAAALALFDRLGNPEAARYRRELIGPSGLTRPARAPDPAALRREGLAPGEAALRHMAFPGAAPAAPALADIAAEALADYYPKVPRAPYYRLQTELGRRAAALVAQGSAVPPAAVEAMVPDLRNLAGPRSLFAGLGLGLSLADGLARAGADEAAHRLLDHLAGMQDAMAEDDRRALVGAAFPRHALAALRDGGTDAGRRAAGLFAALAPALPAPAAAGRWPGASPVFDTLVTVFSCRPNLDTRIPAMRAGWLGRLAALGVPYVVVVGEGAGERDGDILHLDAPDDYEGLPQKTLATIAWVHEHTAFQHMLKIDDDCFLNADAFFHSLSFRKFDYYGRALTRRAGQTDRVWHAAKSRSARGRLELDKSPEPSTYADGGSGYTLGRAAMEAVLAAAGTPEGRHLARVSFMEDKLVGDLLSLRGIAVADEDYRIAIRRRTRPGGRPVALWVNSFMASRAAPVKLVHLDEHESQSAALDLLDRAELAPRKVWPSYAPVTLGFQSNALELLGDEAQLARVNAAPVAVVACLRNEMFMLPHFLAHYRALGVGGFLIADNLSDDGTTEYLAEQPDVALFSVDTDYSQSHYGVAWQQALLSNFRVGRWSVVADADEFLLWGADPRQPLADLLDHPDFAGAEAARAFMLDLYPKGPLADADFAGTDPFAQADHCDAEPFRSDWPGQGPFTDAPTWTSALRHRLIPGTRPDLFVAQKVAILRYRPWMRLSAGLHYVADARLARRDLIFAHFKYNANFRRKAEAEVARRQHFNDAEEYRRYLALVAEGRESIYDPAISVPWRDCAFVRRLFAAEGAARAAG